MKCASSSTAPAVGCGSLQKQLTLSCYTTLPGAVWGISGRCGCATVSSCSAASQTGSTPTRSTSSSSSCGAPAGSPGGPVVVIVDNAKYHHAKLHRGWRENHAGRFVLDFLPPYSPELNPCERVWKLVRRLCVHNTYFPSLENVTAAVAAQFSAWSSGSDTLRRLCAVT